MYSGRIGVSFLKQKDVPGTGRQRCVTADGFLLWQYHSSPSCPLKSVILLHCVPAICFIKQTIVACLVSQHSFQWLFSPCELSTLEIVVLIP